MNFWSKVQPTFNIGILNVGFNENNLTMGNLHNDLQSPCPSNITYRAKQRHLDVKWPHQFNFKHLFLSFFNWMHYMKWFTSYNCTLNDKH